jgi:DNA polymerase-3 subunit gamma/tau
MALLRIIHASSLPDPGDLARQIQAGAPIAPPVPARESPPPDAGGKASAPPTFAALIDMLDTRRRQALAEQLRVAARVVQYAPPEIVLSTARPMPAELPRDLAEALKDLTGMLWRVTTDDASGAPSVREAEADARARALDAIRATPIVDAALEIFPDAEITGWDTPQRSSVS